MSVHDNGSGLLPSYIMETRNSDGTRSVSAIYTTEEYANRYMFMIIALLIGGAFLAAFAALICAVVYISHPNKKQKLFPILGILVCAYLIFDIKHSWYVSLVIDFFAHPLEKYYLVRGTVTMLLVNSILLLAGNTLFNLALKNSILFFLYMVVITLICYKLGAEGMINLLKIKFG